MNAAQIEGNCMNANIAIARRSLSKFGANVALCICVVAKTLFTNVEALGKLKMEALGMSAQKTIHWTNTC